MTKFQFNGINIFTDLTGKRSLEPTLLNKHFIEAIILISTQFVALCTPSAFAIGLYLLFEFNVQSNVQLMLFVWCILEIIFYLYCYALYTKLSWSKTPEEVRLKDHEREKLVDLFVNKNYCDPHTLSNWFNPVCDELVSKEMAKSWLAWCFFEDFHYNLSLKDKKEVDKIVLKIEEVSKIKFPIKDPRPDLNRQPMLLTLDPVVVQHKPLIFYGAVALIQAGATGLLMLLGFQPNYLPNSKFTYWLYDPIDVDTSKPPIFFVHGIGLGVTLYIKKIYDLFKLYPKRKIILLELSYISMTPVTQVNSIESTIDAVDEIFGLHNIKSCSFIGHSYGTVICGWVIKHRPKYVSKLTLVDPVCFAMWEPELTRNFMYAQSKSFIHRMLQFFVSRDLFVGNTIGRNFFWYRNILTPQDLTSETQVYISRYDFIINAPKVYEYLKEVQKEHKNLSLKVNLLPELTHGAYLISKVHSEMVLNEV